MENDGKDCISELPDAILHHILSFLDMKYVVTTSALSTRWKLLWATLPVLNFDKEVYRRKDIGEVEGGPIQKLVDDYILIQECIRLNGVKKDEEKVQVAEEIIVPNNGLHSDDIEEDNFEDEDVDEFEDENVDEGEGKDVADVGDEDDCRRKFKDFVNAVLGLRYLTGGSSNLHTLRLSCEDLALNGDIYKWISIAVNYNVQVLDLQINHYTGFYLELPPKVFTSKYLTMLKLDVPWEKEVTIRVPHKVDLPHLKTLHLISISFDGTDMGSFFSKCSALESLVLSKCTLENKNTISISSLQLKELVLDDLGYFPNMNDLFRFSAQYCKVTVRAPNLASFTCRDYVLHDYSLVDVTSLANADIDMDIASSYLTANHQDHPQFFFRNVIKCLQGLSHVTSLTLSAWLLEAALDAISGLKSEFAPFSNLRYLELKTNLCGAQAVALTFFLNRCLRIETLVLDMTKGPRTRHIWDDGKEVYKEFDLDRWEEGILPEWNFPHLKIVKIRDFGGRWSEIEFLKFSLKNAANLEKVLLYVPNKQLRNTKEFRRLMESVKTFPRASSSVQISSS